MKKLLIGLSALPLAVLPIAMTTSCIQEELPNPPNPLPELSPIELATKLMREHIGREVEMQYNSHVDIMKQEYEVELGLQGLQYHAGQPHLDVVINQINVYSEVIINKKGNYQIKYLTELDPWYDPGIPYYYLPAVCTRGGIAFFAGRIVKIKRDYNNPFEFVIRNGKFVLL